MWYKPRMQRTVMPPFAPLIACALAAIGLAALSRMLAREWRRVNAELDASERAGAAIPREDLPTLRLDPATGVYRPQ
jgi:hypothetical protein